MRTPVANPRVNCGKKEENKDQTHVEAKFYYKRNYI